MTRAIGIAAAVLAALGASRPPEPVAPRVVAAEAHLSAFAFCPDGHTIVGREGTGAWLIEWPAGTAHRVAPATTKSDVPPCPAPAFGFSPDGKWWALPGDTGQVLVRDGKSGATVRALPAHLDGTSAALFSPDGRFLASAGEDNDIHVWDARTWQSKTTIVAMTHTPFALAWAPDSSVLYAAGSSRTVTAWSSSTWTLVRGSAPQRFALGQLAVSSDGQRVAAAGFDPDGSARPAAVLVLDATTLSQRASIATPAPLSALAFSPDGASLLGVSRGQAGITVWPVE